MNTVEASQSTKNVKKQKQKKVSKQKVQKNVEKKGEHYEMDDYELLLARHQLIQQQLQKVKGTLFISKSLKVLQQSRNSWNVFKIAIFTIRYNVE